MAATEPKKKKKKKKNKSTLLVVLLMVAGLAVMLYPTLSNVYNELTGSYAIQEFNDNLANRDELELIEERAKAENRKASFQMVVDDVYAIGKGRLVGRPKY